tara:strand:+ start:13300 stop:14424 length:1125 start_codon:yes stop_codon:yes gene_type:complete
MLDLFSGIGGFSLAASWVWGDDLEIAGFCEIDKYCEKVLNKNFPGVPVYKDITQLDGTQFKNIDLITGGFPCQDISVAGKGKGLFNEETGEKTRSGLWVEMLRIISEVRPRYALIENVPMLTVRGGTRVIADLTEIGYDASWDIISAQDRGALHKRARIWIVAYPDLGDIQTGRNGFRGVCSKDREKRTSNNVTSRSKVKANFSYPKSSNDKTGENKRRWASFQSGRGGRRENVSDSTSIGLSRKTDKQIVEGEGRGELLSVKPGNSRTMEEISNSNRKRSQRMESQSQKSQRSDKQTGLQGGTGNGGWWDVEPRMGLLADGVSTELAGCWDREPDIPRVTTGIKDRIHKLRGLGNAIVPQVAYYIMKKLHTEI